MVFVYVSYVIKMMILLLNLIKPEIKNFFWKNLFSKINPDNLMNYCWSMCKISKPHDC